MNQVMRSILHPTDLTPASAGAFAHALRIALAAKCKLQVLHVLQDRTGEGWEHSHVRLRLLLTQWGLLGRNEPLDSIDTKLGVPIENIMLDRQQPPTEEIVHFLNQNATDLVVLATHGRDGIDHWLQGSVAESVFKRSAIPTLFIPLSARGFVDQVTGDFRMRRVLVPVDRIPPPYRAIEAAKQFHQSLTSADVAMQLLHIGRTIPELGKLKNQVVVRYGNVVQTILDAAIEYDVDFICMPTAGHHGVLDALRGSTTERVVRHAPCPVLAISSAV